MDNDDYYIDYHGGSSVDFNSGIMPIRKTLINNNIAINTIQSNNKDNDNTEENKTVVMTITRKKKMITTTTTTTTALQQ